MDKPVPQNIGGTPPNNIYTPSMGIKMTNPMKEYVLTVVHHTYCADCAVIKNKIAEVYILSGLQRGEQSKHWRVQLLSPPWDRGARRREFPVGFPDIDVPALKLEVNGRIVAVTQSPGVISAVLARLKQMLTDRLSNEEMASEINRLAHTSNIKLEDDVCPLVPEQARVG
jgi:hypothetical protein